MKQRHFLSLFGMVFVLCLSLLARGQTLTINGPDTMCVNSSGAYYLTNTTPGDTYGWSTTLGAVQGSTFGTAANIVWGGTAGTATIKVRVYSGSMAIDSVTKNVELVSVPTPSIYTDYHVACIKAYDNDTAGSGGEPVKDTLFFDDNSGCHKVCEDAYVDYGVNGSGGQYQWTAVGGTIIGSSTSSTVTVQWGSPGSGSLTVAEYYGSCTTKRTICIDIIEKPIAAFSVLPSTDPVEDCDTFDLCLDSKIAFKNLSTGSSNSQIVSWYWDFGDNTTSAQKVPPPHSYASSGSGVYQVWLVVTNECGCVDSFCAHVNVYQDAGPPIFCQAVACENDSVQYCTNLSSCTSYNWEVVNGTIVTNNDTCITVLWDGIAGTDGFGYVSLDVQCTDVCPAPNTIKVPVIQQDPEVTGPTTLCIGNQYKFSIPLWPGTEYNWGVLSNPGAVVNNVRKSNEVYLKFTSAGTYDVHVTWQNHIALCGGDKTFQVVVLDNDTIVGNTTACKSSSTTVPYSLSSSNSTNWELIDPSGGSSTSYGSTYNATFTMTGVYKLYALDYCADPLFITVTELAYAVDSVDGEDTVCPDKPYIYNAYGALPGTIFSWTADGGTIQGSPSGSSVTVKWDGTLPGTLIVRRQSTTYPYCEGPGDTIHITEASLDPHITGPDTVCSDSYGNIFDANYSVTGATYTWKVIPDTTGNVVIGTYGSQVEFKANYFAVPTLSSVAFEMKQCDSVRRDTFEFWIVPKPIPSITGTDTLCSGFEASLTATAGASSYDWDFGDGSFSYATGNSVSHYYWNSSGSPITYTVHAVLSGGTINCPPNGDAYWKVTVLSGPQLSLYSNDTSIYCDTATNISTTINSSVSGTGPFGYQWYNGSGAIMGATNTSYTATAGGAYFLIVTDSGTGCRSRARWDIVVLDCDTCPHTPIITGYTPAFNCGSFSVTGSASPTPPWNEYYNWDIYPDGPEYINSETKTATQYDVGVNKAGSYKVYYSRRYGNRFGDTCIATSAINVDVPLVANFYYDFECDYVNQEYDIVLTNSSTYMEWWNNSTTTPNTTNLSWTVKQGMTTVATGTTSPFTPSLPPGSYTVQLVVELENLHPPAIGYGTCTTQVVLNVPQWPTVTIDYDPDDICEGLPIELWPVFSPTSSKSYMADYLWDFDDNAYSKLDTTHRVYTYNPATPTPPQNFGPLLTVTDVWECVHTSNTGSIDIWQNDLSGTVSGGTTVCTGPVSLTYVPDVGSGSPTKYMWSNQQSFVGTNPTDVYTSGSYYVTVEDAHSCRHVTNPADVTIINLQNTGIMGRTDYCEGESVFLSGFAGVGANLTYTWKRGGTPVGGNTPYLNDPGLAASTYNYTLDIVYNDGVTSCSTSVGPVAVTIHAAPTAPSITGLSVIDCDLYELQLSGSGPGGGTLSWSNGTSGSPTTIYSGGPYRLFYYDNNGCMSFNDTLIPESPESYFGWFPDGCYEVCNTQYPFWIFGPPGIWDAWQWTAVGGAGSTVSGTNSVVPPYSITADDDYTLSLDNGLCSQTTDIMSVASRDCTHCPSILVSYTFTCDNTNPGGYTLALTINNPYINDMDVTIGLGSGPIIPFKLTVPSGSNMYNLYAVTMQGPPDTIEVSFSTPGGTRCFERIFVDPSNYTYPCSWPSQRPGKGEDSTGYDNPPLSDANKLNTGMLAYPNPASHSLTINYNYGIENDNSRRIVIYDMVGRRIASLPVNTFNSSEKLDVASWAQGVYVVRMEENGKAVHTLRVTITH